MKAQYIQRDIWPRNQPLLTRRLDMPAQPVSKVNTTITNEQARHVAHTDTQYTPPVDTDVHINTTLTHHAWTVPVEVELHKLLTLLDTGVRYSLVAKK